MSEFLNASANTTVYISIANSFINFQQAALNKTPILPNTTYYSNRLSISGSGGIIIYLYLESVSTNTQFMPFWVGYSVQANDKFIIDPDAKTIKVNSMLIRARPNQAYLTPAQQSAFIITYMQLDASGTLGKIVQIHSQMVHDMHGYMGASGIQRFLPWHRVYLYMLEQELLKLDPTVMIPYWDWTYNRAIPKWINDFKPVVIMPPDNDPPKIEVVRNPGDEKNLPSENIVDSVLRNKNYTSFTSQEPQIPFAGGGLEGIHNSVHGWFAPGSTMNSIPIASADPIFWMHHAQIDRLWWQWSMNNQQSFPILLKGFSDDQGQPANIMDPWNVSELTTRDILNAFNYTYSFWRFN